MKKITIILFLFSLCLSLTACAGTDYSKAVELMDAGEYENAAIILETIPDYKDSNVKLSECNYSIACEAMDNHSYDKAIKYFESLGEYKESSTNLKECKYQIATEKMNSGDYDSANSLFLELGNYKDSLDLSDACENYFDAEIINLRIEESVNSVLTDSSSYVHISDSDGLYYVSFGTIPLKGNIFFNHMNDNGDVEDEGITNHLSYIIMVTSKDELETAKLFVSMMGPAILCGVDEDFNNDFASAFGCCNSYIEEINNSSGDASVSFSHNGYNYKVSSASGDGFYLLGFQAAAKGVQCK